MTPFEPLLDALEYSPVLAVDLLLSYWCVGIEPREGNPGDTRRLASTVPSSLDPSRVRVAHASLGGVATDRTRIARERGQTHRTPYHAPVISRNDTDVGS